MTTKGPVSQFIKYHYRHFNAAAVVRAAEGYDAHLASGGKMFVTLAGAMSTAEIGLSLAEMIRQGKVHGISCTGANLEEDVFNLVAHDHYERIPHYLSPQTIPPNVSTVGSTGWRLGDRLQQIVLRWRRPSGRIYGPSSIRFGRVSIASGVGHRG